MILFFQIYVPDAHQVEFVKTLKQTIVDFERKVGIVSTGPDNPDEFHMMMTFDPGSATAEEVVEKFKPVMPYMKKFPFPEKPPN